MPEPALKLLVLRLQTAVAVVLLFQVLVGDHELVVAEAAERHVETVVDGVDEQLVAGPLPLEAEDERVA